MTNRLGARNLTRLTALLALALAAPTAWAGHPPLSPAARPTAVEQRSSPQNLLAPREAGSAANRPPPAVSAPPDDYRDGLADQGYDDDVRQRQAALDAIPIVIGVPILAIGGMVCGLIGVLLTALHLPAPRRRK